MKDLRQNAKGRWGGPLGIIVMLPGCALLWLGGFSGLDQIGFDYHVRNFSTVEADSQITLIDIDDSALREIGGYPWPRRRYAQLIDILNELGAKAIALDLVLSDPNAPRWDADLNPHYDVDTDIKIVGDPASRQPIYDDNELRDAITRAGNVYLGMFFIPFPPGVDPELIRDHALAMVRDRPTIDEQTFHAGIMAAFPVLAERRYVELLSESLYHSTRIVDALGRDFGLDAQAVARNLNIDPGLAKEYLPRAKRAAAWRAASSFLRDHPDARFLDFYVAVLPAAPRDRVSLDRSDLRDAFRQQRSFRAIAANNPALPSDLEGRMVHADEMTLPVDKFAAAAKGVGFVSFPREGTGGVVRDIPLLAGGGGILQMQLGLIVAADILGLDRSAIAVEHDRIVIGQGEEQRTLFLGNDGLTPINWHVPKDSSRWLDSFEHVPALRLLEIAVNRETVRENQTRLRIETADLVKLRHADTPADYTAYVELVNRRLAWESKQAAGAGSADVPSGVAPESLEVERAIGAVEAEALLWLKRAHSLWRNETPADEEEKAIRARVLTLHENLVEGRLVSEIASLNAALEMRSAALLIELKPLLSDKICMVGYTASGVADLVASPAFDSMPGVMAHANVINMVLNDAPLVRAPGIWNLLLMLLAGAVVTAFTATRDTKTGVIALVLVEAVLMVSGAASFRLSTYHLATFPAVANTLFVWACVAIYRQLTEERTRRRFQQALAQYTSPAVAARMAEKHRAADLIPRRTVVTCFFSDLYGFTALSERLGAERTRQVLNPYLRAMSRVLVDHDGLINKFVGDGIFAFFNAPVLLCERHADAACRAALDCMKALRVLNADFEGTLIAAALSQRIGLSTGEVFVGDYGSDTKLDYTCIGDTVNVGARLESASKDLGTSILVDAATRNAVGDAFSFRNMGRVMVPGKTLPVEVSELLGHQDTLDDATREFVTHFDAAVLHYQCCEWEPCRAELDACRALRPTDRAVERYWQAVSQHSSTPTKDAFDGALPLAGASS